MCKHPFIETETYYTVIGVTPNKEWVTRQRKVCETCKRIVR